MTLLAVAAVPATGQQPLVGVPDTPPTIGPQSISGSFVVLDPSAGGSTCASPDATQTFCFRTETFAPDAEDAVSLYLRFPSDWVVNDVSVTGTPTCDAGSFGTFSWSRFLDRPYESHVAHGRTMPTGDHCVATYCIDVDTGNPGSASWYWAGEGTGGVPHAPCSSDGYSPDGLPACDEAVEPAVGFAACDPGLYFTPGVVELVGCSGSSVDGSIGVLNATGSGTTVSLTYDVPGGLGTLTGPPSVFVPADATVAVDVTMSTPLCLYAGTEVDGIVHASGNGYSDDGHVVQVTDQGSAWSSVPASAPSWAGLAFPADGCTAVDASGHFVTYILGDTSGNGLAGLWGYDHTTEIWSARSATGTPTDRWAPDWAYDPDTNTCYLTGGASFPGGGDLTAAYGFEPVTATFSTLPSFSTPRAFHDSWVATLDGVRMLCIGGGVNVAGATIGSTQCYDLDATPGSWQTENSVLGGYPTGGSWGSADGVRRSPGADQLWVVAGVVGSLISGHAIYFDDSDDSWHSVPDVPTIRYRVEGEFVGDAFFLVGGSLGSFSFTDTVFRGADTGGGWAWEPFPPAPNARMDNVVAALGPDGLRSVDGFGSTSAAYVDDLGLCPSCQEIGFMQGALFDAEIGGAVCQPGSVVITPGDLSAATDAGGSYGPLGLIASSEVGPYDVTAAAPGYAAITATGVTIVTGSTTTQDFGLVRPVAGVTPDAFDASVATGSSLDAQLTISNSGNAPLDFELVETPQTVSPMTSPDLSPPIPAGVSAEVWSQLLDTGSADYLVYFDDRPELTPALSLDRSRRGEFVVSALRGAAERSQTAARDLLDRRGVPYRGFWIANVIAVSGSDRETLERLRDLPGVQSIQPSRVYRLYEPESTAQAPIGIRAVEANLSHVGADEVWGMGFDGTGIVVANIDTGVRFTHEVLVDHYRGNLGGGSFDHDYGWLDPVTSSAVPIDDHGHGSHTMGTMVGDDGGANQTGMAPGAEWIACRACSATGGCPAVPLLTCAEWIAAPYPIGNPGAADPSRRPNVVNNSWGDCGTVYDGWFQSVVDAWHAAGVYPVFSNGNASNCGYATPPGCNTVGNPGRYGNVTSVGSTGTSNGQYATHSNWGPTDHADTVNPAGFSTIKPQVAAPGVLIRSAIASTDSAYGSWTGTSMSAPHVSGLVALMWQAASCLVGDYAATETIIQETAHPIPYASACGGEGPGDVPNQATGWGEIDATAAVLAAIAHCDTDWLPWVSENPTSGTTAAVSDSSVTLTFQCTADGDNQGALRLLSSDPCVGPVEIPLSLHCAPGSATLIAVNQTVPIGAAQSFAFTGAVAGAMRDGDSLSAAPLPPGTFTVTETPVAGWSLDSISCDDADSTGDVGGLTATYRLGAAETVTCTFVNHQTVGVCGYPVDIVLGRHSESATTTWHACQTITAQDGFEVAATGVVTFRAGSSIALGNGFTVGQGGVFTATLDSTLQ